MNCSKEIAFSMRAYLAGLLTREAKSLGNSDAVMFQKNRARYKVAVNTNINGENAFIIRLQLFFLISCSPDFALPVSLSVST
jgi:hypothetical protein